MIIEDMNTLSQGKSVELILELGSSIAKLESIENIVKNAKYDGDAIHAIKCVLGMIDEEEEKE
jgi:hypothetical protein